MMALYMYMYAELFFQVVQEQQEFRDMATELAELLNIELDHTNIISDNLRSDSVRERLKDMMGVIKEILEFIEAHLNSNSLGEPRDDYSDTSVLY